jgi:hypothetical protein
MLLCQLHAVALYRQDFVVFFHKPCSFQATVCISLQMERRMRKSSFSDTTRLRKNSFSDGDRHEEEQAVRGCCVGTYTHLDTYRISLT